MLFIEYHTLTAMNGQDDDIDPLSPPSLEIVDSPHQSDEDNASTTLKNSTTTSPPPSSSPDDRLYDLISKTIVELLPQDADTRDPEISDNIKSYVRLKLLSRPELDSAEASDDIDLTSEEIHSQHETNTNSIFNNVSILSLSNLSIFIYPPRGELSHISFSFIIYLIIFKLFSNSSYR